MSEVSSVCWTCRNESCSDYKTFNNIGSRVDKATGLDEHYCISCDVPLVRFFKGSWVRVGWNDVIRHEEYEEVVVKTRTWVEEIPVRDTPDAWIE